MKWIASPRLHLGFCLTSIHSNRYIRSQRNPPSRVKIAVKRNLLDRLALLFVISLLVACGSGKSVPEHSAKPPVTDATTEVVNPFGSGPTPPSNSGNPEPQNGLKIETNAAAPRLISDGAGGTILAWIDGSKGTESDLYAQRVDGSGIVQWGASGVAVSTAMNDQGGHQIISDGTGGAILVWEDRRNGKDWDIYAQRISAAGRVLWTPDGVALSTAANDQVTPRLIPDGAGGAIVTWIDGRSGTDWEIYIQRIDGNGEVKWPAGGVALSKATDTHSPATTPTQSVVSDGSGGAIVVWNDFRNGNWDLYSQRVDASGTLQWPIEGVPVSTAANDQLSPQTVSDGAGGAVVAWYDFRSGTNWDIYAQRVDGDGKMQWLMDGVVISTAIHHQISPQLASDGSGGAIIAWIDFRSGTDQDLYAQRVDQNGAAQWTADGVPISTAPNDQLAPQIVSDNDGGAIVAWTDRRNGNEDIFAQRISRSGEIQWAADGIAVSTAADRQHDPQLISDGTGGAIITWQEHRSGTSDVYAEMIHSDGNK